MKKASAAGFTLLELILALTVLGIISALVFSTIHNNANARDVAHAAERMRSNLRFAVLGALSGDHVYRITFTPGINGFYALEYQNGNVILSTNFPGEPDTAPVGNGVVLATAGMTDEQVVFDHWGRPCDNLPVNSFDKTEVSGLQQTKDDIVLTLSKGSHSVDIIITKGTGFLR